MLRSRGASPPCWKWAPVRLALSLWQGTTMLEAQEGLTIQRVVWLWGQCVVAAPPGTTSSAHPQRTARAGRSIAQDWVEGQSCILNPTPSWSPKASQPAMTPSTSHTCLATLLLYTQTASVSPLMWFPLLRLESGCLGWTEIWQSVLMWSRDVGVDWLSRETLLKPTKPIRFRAHLRRDARSGSKYKADDKYTLLDPFILPAKLPWSWT